MSWLSNLAGHAERLLDSVDRQAGETLKHGVPLPLGLSALNQSTLNDDDSNIGNGDGDGEALENGLAGEIEGNNDTAGRDGPGCVG